MGLADSRTRSQKMAADMAARGIYHGKRTTKPHHCNYPALNEVGSAAYRRRQAKGKAS